MLMLLQLVLPLVLSAVLQQAGVSAAARSSSMIDFTDESCYNKSGKAKFCQPQFGNVALNRPVHATSTCGARPTRICKRSRQRRSRCPVCDARFRHQSHPASHLTDYQVKNTCWVSDLLSPQHNSVNLTLSLHKKYVVYYASLSSCQQPLPDAIEVLKSFDYGNTWQLWHLFSKNCMRDYGKVGRPYEFKQRVAAKEIVCSDINSIVEMVPGRNHDDALLTFSTNFHRGTSSSVQDADPILLNWMLVTDIRFVLRRHPRANGSVPQFPFAFSDIDIGGRCFCNGHARRCIRKQGREVCECSHGTEGDDCERCRPFFVDMPWRRSTAAQPFQCKRCNCNSHTNHCAFSVNQYKMSGHTSGGLCLNCMDYTTGRQCEQCMPTFQRNFNVKLDSPTACTTCNCHPLGSKTNVCNRNTGRCVCKEGVEGNKCDRCSHGYMQTVDTTVPCWKPGAGPPRIALPPYAVNRYPKFGGISRNKGWQPPNQAPTAVYAPVPAVRPKHIPNGSGGRVNNNGSNNRHKNRNNRNNNRDNNINNNRTNRNNRKGSRNKRHCKRKCKSSRRQLNLSDYCISDWVLSVKVKRVKRRKKWVKVKAIILLGIKCSSRSRSSSSSSSSSSCPAAGTEITIWIRRRLWRCNCPKMKQGRRFLILTRHRSRNGKGLIINHRSLVWQWQSQMLQQLQQLPVFTPAVTAATTCIDCKCMRRLWRQRRRRRRRQRRKNSRGKRRRDSSGSSASGEQFGINLIYGGTAGNKNLKKS